MNKYSHFYLYAKGHYKRSESIENDLKMILSDCTGINPAWLGTKDVISVLSDVAYTHIKEESHLFNQFISDLSPSRNDLFKLFEMEVKETTFEEDLLNALLKVLRWRDKTKIHPKLAELNKNILPLYSEEK